MIMCIIKDYINTAINRLNDFLPIGVNLIPADKKILKGLPMGLVNAFDYYVGDIIGIRTLYAGIDGELSGLTPKTLERQKNILKEKTGLPVVFIFHEMPSYLFSRYVKRGLNIIVGNKHLFLPDFLLVVGKDVNTDNVIEENMSSTAQFIILYHIEKNSLEGMTTRQLTDILGISYASVNRALRWLSKKGFVKLEGGKEKRIRFMYDPKELWIRSKDKMSSPVEFKAYTPELWLGEKGYLSGENALAEYSMLNGGPYCVALSKKTYRQIKDKVFWDPYGEAAIEIWKYDPGILAQDGVVDRLSLYLSMKDNEDDRVQIELDNMMHDMVW